MNDRNTGVRKLDRSDETCVAIHDTLDRIGDKWTVLVVGVLQHGPLRYNEIRRAIVGISQRMLTLTLKALERDGLVERTVYPTVPPRVDYELTELGRNLMVPLRALSDWATKYRPAMLQARQRYADKLRLAAQQTRFSASK